MTFVTDVVIEGMRLLIPFTNEVLTLYAQVVCRDEIDDAQALVLQDTELLFHLIYPRTMHGCEMHDKSWMLGEPSGDLLAMMRTDVVTHEMNRPDVLGNLLVHMFQKGDAFLLPFKLPRQFGAVPLGEDTAQPIGAFTGQAHDVDGDLRGENRPWHRGQERQRGHPAAGPETVWPICTRPCVGHQRPGPRRSASAQPPRGE